MQTLSEKISWFVINFVVSLLGVILADGTHPTLPAPPSPPPIVNPAPPAPPMPPPAPVDPQFTDVDVKIPQSMRIYNKSGNQCVWCSLEMLGRHNGSKGCEGLTDVYKDATGSGEVRRVLTQRNVKFLQVENRRDYSFIKKWVNTEKKGVGIGVGHHMVLVCGFKENQFVKVIDNANSKLPIETWSWDKFTRRFDGWAIVVLGDNDSVPTCG